MSRTIKLGRNDGAVIFRANGTEELSLPKMRDDEMIGPHLELLAAFVGRLTVEKGFAEEMRAWLKSQPAPPMNS